MPETQAFSASRSVWTPPSGTLGELVESAYGRSLAAASQSHLWQERAESAPAVPSFTAALSQSAVGVIAEVKRRSPSKGDINPGMDAVARARSYASSGAVAISVLTEPARFGGSLTDLSDVAGAVAVPVLRKDFIVSAIQLYEARASGASAALLIARALAPNALKQLHEVGSAIGLELLVEIRDEAELAVALDVGARIIGVNNRNLETLVIDRETVMRVIPLIPNGIIAVAESGMTSRADVERASETGADAVLIGSAVSASTDADAAIRSLVAVPVRRDVRQN